MCPNFIRFLREVCLIFSQNVRSILASYHHTPRFQNICRAKVSTHRYPLRSFSYVSIGVHVVFVLSATRTAKDAHSHNHADRRGRLSASKKPERRRQVSNFKEKKKTASQINKTKSKCVSSDLGDTDDAFCGETLNANITPTPTPEGKGLLGERS